MMSLVRAQLGEPEESSFLTALFFVVQQIIKMAAVVVIYEVQLCSQVYIRLCVNGWEKQKKVSVSVVRGIKQEIFGSMLIVGVKP